MSEVEQQAVIKISVIQGKASQLIHELRTALKDSALSYSTVKHWAAFFKQGQDSCEDVSHGGGPSTAVTKETVAMHETMRKVVSCGFKLLPHPPNSPDLAPSDFHLFPYMKKQLWSVSFTNDEETKVMKS
ncbi:hypothetical protein O3P69_016781 [Scylla paramamosain]|uniref:Mos1 transposase HTH domain-containing protein n=1 Tax=Scylla paramamosain TaxID=85552 RepID=A0AAW0SZ49_SCYPA